MDSISVKDYTLIRQTCSEYTRLLIHTATGNTNLQYSAVLRLDSYEVAEGAHTMKVVFAHSGATTEYKFNDTLKEDDMRKLREFLLA